MPEDLSKRMFFKSRYQDEFPFASSLFPSKVFKDRLTLGKAWEIFKNASIAYGWMETLILEQMLLSCPDSSQLQEASNIAMESDNCSDGETIQNPPSKTAIKLLPHGKHSLLSLEEGKEFSMVRLQHLGFVLSSSQPETPADGNCLFHALLDQIG